MHYEVSSAGRVIVEHQAHTQDGWEEEDGPWFGLCCGVVNKLKVIYMNECYRHGHSAVQGVSLEVKGWRSLLSLKWPSNQGPPVIPSGLKHFSEGVLWMCTVKCWVSEPAPCMWRTGLVLRLGWCWHVVHSCRSRVIYFPWQHLMSQVFSPPGQSMKSPEMTKPTPRHK